MEGRGTDLRIERKLHGSCMEAAWKPWREREAGRAFITRLGAYESK